MLNLNIADVLDTISQVAADIVNDDLETISNTSQKTDKPIEETPVSPTGWTGTHIK